MYKLCEAKSRVCGKMEARDQYNRGCAVKSRLIISTIEGVQNNVHRFYKVRNLFERTFKMITEELRIVFLGF